MSQYGGGKPGSGAWGRPVGAGANQMAGFPGMGVGAFPMMSMGMPMGMVNQAAFSQPGMMGMGVMGAVPQQTASARSASGVGSGGAPSGGKNQRTFVGVVTKMHDSYGFVDDDVFFQHSVIRGALPRVGDKVMVEASYNPQMPFKWNAYRIQLLNANDGGQGLSSQINSNQNVRNSAPSGRWGPIGAQERNGPPRGASPQRRRSPPPRRNSPPRRGPSPGMRKDGLPQRMRKSPPLRRSPPRRTTPPRERIDRKRERERSDNGPPSVAPSTKRDSASPPRRRARIIPRYDCRPPKPVLLGDQVSVVNVRSRYPKMYVPSDFADLSAEWAKRVPLDTPIDLTNAVSFHIWHKDVDYPVLSGDNDIVLEPEDADHRHQVKVLLLTHGGKQELHKKSFGLMPDGTTDDSHEPIPMIKHLQFLVGVRGKENMAIGGSWSPSLDGEDPTSPATIIRTAIRTTKALTGVDLSDVPQWYQLVQVRYYRADKDRIDRVHLLWPDTQMLSPDEAQWTSLQTALRAQLDVKLAAIDTQSVKDDSKEGDSPKPVSKESPVRAPTQAEASTPTKTCVLNAITEETPSKESENEGDVESKEEPTHWSQLDVKSMKVAELRAELEARGLETKGIKTLLAQRLQEAVDKEQEADGSQSRNGEDVEMKDETDVVTEKDEEDPAALDAANEKSEAEIKKEAEELQKKVEKLEKEKKEKKAALERHYTFPKEQRVLVYPSKIAKGGKFDCKLVSLQSLLEYRQDDNKESQFEVSLFAEAFKEMLERQSAFAIYHAISNAADKESERKRRDEARGKKDEDKKEEEKKEGEEKEKKEEEKVELKSIISNRQLFEAFAMYDVNLCGYIAERDLEDILFNSEFGITRGQVQKLAHKLSSREKINYRHLTDILVDSDGNTKFVPGNCEGAPDVETLLRGYGITYINAIEQSSGSNNIKISQSSDSNVIINGNVINVPQKLALLKKSEVERDQAKAALCEQKSLVDQLRESKQDLEKKKKDLERELDKCRKKLNDTGVALKTSLEDGIALKSALADCKKYSERVIASVDRACPPPKKEEPKEEEKIAEEDEPIPAEIILAEEVGPEEDNVEDQETVEKEN